MYEVYCRIYQFVMKYASRILPWTKPKLIVGPNSILNLPDEIKNMDINKVLIVTDKTIVELGLLGNLIS